MFYTPTKFTDISVFLINMLFDLYNNFVALKLTMLTCDNFREIFEGMMACDTIKSSTSTLTE